MGIRVRPVEIEIPKADPFKNDLLNRKEPAENLTRLIDGIEGPCVLAIDAAWGAGKTTFLKMWAQHLRNEQFTVVEFNAWETDHAGDPFVAIVAELTEGLREFADESLTEKIRETAEAAKQVALRAIPGAIRILTAGVLDVQPLLEKEAGKLLASYAEDRLKKYTEAKDSIEGFRNKLQDMAKSLAVSKTHPLIVMVDELDRCRPSYAVELIEVAKHLFAVDHTVFVLAINRDQLAHSIKALYGNDFDATGYLRRFLDVDFRLPNADRKSFIDTMIKSTNVNEDVREILHSFFGVPDVSLRQVGQAIHRLGLVAASMNGTKAHFAAGVALILRTLDVSLYSQFIEGIVPDIDMAKSIFKRLGMSHSNWERDLGVLQFEATVALSYYEMSIGDRFIRRSETISTPLVECYRKIGAGEESDDVPQWVTRNHAQLVIEIVESLTQTGRSFVPLGFRDAVRRIELLYGNV